MIHAQADDSNAGTALRSLARDEPGSWERTVDLLSSDVQRIAWSIIRDANLVQDAVQEVFLHLRRQAPRFLNEKITDAYAYSWSRRVCVNCCLGMRRKHRMVQRKERPLSVPMLDSRADPVTAPGEHHDAHVALMEALSILAEHDRAVLCLRYMEGQSIESVAASMGCSQGAVRVRLHRAISRLRRIMQPMLPATFSAAGFGEEECAYALHCTAVEAPFMPACSIADLNASAQRNPSLDESQIAAYQPFTVRMSPLQWSTFAGAAAILLIWSAAVSLSSRNVTGNPSKSELAEAQRTIAAGGIAYLRSGPMHFTSTAGNMNLDLDSVTLRWRTGISQTRKALLDEARRRSSSGKAASAATLNDELLPTPVTDSLREHGMHLVNRFAPMHPGSLASMYWMRQSENLPDGTSYAVLVPFAPLYQWYLDGVDTYALDGTRVWLHDDMHMGQVRSNLEDEIFPFRPSTDKPPVQQAAKQNDAPVPRSNG